ncbi:hypothetical protein WN48_05104 [Eufriesea mexicana]|nr:hypothetical protein WN48_05104 [Eufriesea mexicana]
MDMESLYDYGEEEQDFYEESPGTRKGYPIDHRSIKRDARGVGSYLGGGSISDGGGMLTVMAKLMKQELASDAEEEGLVPALSGRFTSMRKVPSLSDLSDPESSLELDPSVEYRYTPRVAQATLEGAHSLGKGCKACQSLTTCDAGLAEGSSEVSNELFHARSSNKPLEIPMLNSRFRDRDRGWIADARRG